MTIPSDDKPFIPALIVVDFQEDFCPPNGSLAVPDGRAIAPHVNALLELPFALKLATRDWHPPEHISFAENHGPEKRAFVDTVLVTHPDLPSSSSTLTSPHHTSLSASASVSAHASSAASPYETTLWPVHCVRNTPGAALVPALRADRLHAVVDKGTHPRVEMYSAFCDPFGVEDSGVAARLADRRVSHVFVVGLAADYCVKATAESACDLGFVTYIVDEAVRAIHPDKWPASAEDIVKKGVRVVSMDGPEVERVKSLA